MANQRLSNLLAQATSRSSLPQDEFAELLRLRGQAGLGRRLKDENPKVRAENAKLRSASKVVNAPAPKEPDDPSEAAFQKETHRRQENLSQWGLMFIMAANKNKDQSPDTWEQVAGQMGPEQLQFATNNFEIVYHGKLAQDGSGETILFREIEARQSPSGEWCKVYGFADGHTEIQTEPDGNFAAWEQPRLASSR